jgi:hypothetical protein
MNSGKPATSPTAAPSSSAAPRATSVVEGESFSAAYARLHRDQPQCSLSTAQSTSCSLLFQGGQQVRKCREVKRIFQQCPGQPPHEVFSTVEDVEGDGKLEATGSGFFFLGRGLPSWGQAVSGGEGGEGRGGDRGGGAAAAVEPGGGIGEARSTLVAAFRDLPINTANGPVSSASASASSASATASAAASASAGR